MSRETEIQLLCQGVLDLDLEKLDNPYGGYEAWCPFCCATQYDYESQQHWSEDNMKEFSHKSDCIYLIARHLKT